MTSKVKMTFDKSRGNTPRLPHIQNGRSLVSPASSARTPTYRNLAEDWASTIRQRLMNKVQQHDEIDENELRMLKEEIKALFITALQRDNHHTWLYLKECIKQLAPLSHLLQGHADLVHYLKRLQHHLNIHKEKLFALQIDKTVNEVFTKDLETIQNTIASSVKSYSVPTPAASVGTPVHKQPPKLTLPDGKNPYVLERPEDNAEIKPRPLTFGDLRQSLPNVALEMATREAIWNACMGTTAIAMNTDFPECLEEVDEDDVEEELLSDVSDYSSQSAFEDLGLQDDLQEQTHPKTPMSGREAVQYFTKCYHLGQIKFMYFNMAPSRRYMPYDLVAATKSEIEPEHFIFSTFGVLHVFPRQPSENLSLAAWQREAVIFSTIIKIPFFKYYLLKRMFNKWRSNVHFKEFSTIRHQISEGLLQAVPSFGAALLHISKLCQELLNLTFLPTDTVKCYELGDFKNVVNYMKMQAEKILERFFRYNKVIVDTTAEESFKKLQHCEEQNQHKPLFSKDSLTLQKAKRRQRALNLVRAREETNRLGNFVKLVDQMLLAHLVQLARVSVTKFVYDSMAKGTETQREALFKAKLVFNEENALTMSPAKDHFISMLSETFEEIPQMLCQAALPLDGALHLVPERTTTDSVSNPVTQQMAAPNRHQSMATLMRDPKKQKVETLRRDMAAAATTMMMSDNSVRMSQGSSRKVTSTKGSMIHTPDITREALPTKADDEMGQATPDLIISAQKQHELAVSGRGFIGQYTPLSHGNLAEKLTQDAAYKHAIAAEEEIMNAALVEIAEFCEKSSWLSEIYAFCKSWTEDSVKEWRGVQAFNIEQRLTELRFWGDRVRNFEQTYVTDNGVFFIDCSGVQDFLLKKLDDIFNELCMFVADEASNLAKEFSDELVSIVENMKQKDTDIAGFAIYAKNVSQYKKNTMAYQQRIEYIKSLFEVIRMSYRQLTPEEEKLEESVMTHWEAFLFLMQDAMDFVNTQTPLITQNLEDRVMQSYGSQSTASSASIPLQPTKLSSAGDQHSRKYVDSAHKSVARSSAVSPADSAGHGNRDLQKLEEQARALCDAATSGIFLDPTQKPTQILMEMRHLRDSFYDIQKQLEQGSKWREAIIGEPCDLTFLHEMSTRMTVRQQLWRYVEVSQHAITEWKQTLFVKFNCHKVMDKILEWQSTGEQLKEDISPDDDVLVYWLRVLDEFQQELPLLNKLSSEALKPRHWRTIFLGIGEQYNADVQLTVEDLLSYNLRAHTDVINHVYKAAVTEYSIEHRLANLSKFWSEREFKLAKHIPDSVYKKEEVRARSAKSGTSNRKLRRLDKFRQERGEHQAPKGLIIDRDNLFVLIEVEELKYLLEDSRVQIETMLTSPYVADHKIQVSKWSEVLGQAEEIVDLWVMCQKKWLYLLKVFDNVDFFMKMSDLGQRFEVVHNKFMDIVCAAMHDPKVISIVNHARNEKGYRLQQGDRARDTLLAAIEEQEVILKHLNTRLDAARSLFPRLYFLSSTEIVELLAISRNPRALQASAKKCFHGIDSLTYMLPNSSVSVDTSLDVELNAHKLEVTEIHGILGETLPLYTRLEAYASATKWLSNLEEHMKTTLQIVLENCLQAQLDEGSKQPIQLLEELSKYEQLSLRSEAEDLKKDIKETFSHWIMRFPAQCVLTADAILWERAVFRCLEKQDREELKLIRTKIQSRVEEYVKVLQENSVMSLPKEMRIRIKLLLGSLIIQGLYQLDNVDNLLANSDLSDGAFDWLRILKHHMDIRTVLRAVTDISQSADSLMPESYDKQSHDFTFTHLKHGREETSRLQRGKTTVCTGYQFGPCIVSQMGAGFSYDHEYLGPTSRLVITPLTERATLSMTLSLRSFQCSTLIGPPGTGKTDTVKDLAQSLGHHMVSVTCSSDLTLPVMNQYLNGMIQSGSWVLFDDVDRMSKGLMSVFAQQLEYIGSALRVLDVSCDNQYGIRGQPRFDKKDTTKLSEKKIRRNSLTTLHSLPADGDNMALNRQATVPHGFKENGLVTYFEETWVGERERRHSIEKEIEIKESELYKSMKPPPLFYEHVTLHLKAKQDFSDLASQNLPYKQHYLGNIMFCGKLVRASANFGSFMTMNTTNPQSCDIPDNLRTCMRPCAMVVPDTKIIIETTLFCYGYNKYQVLAAKLATFMELLKKQLPSKEQYDFGLRTINAVLHLACEKFTKLQLDIAEAVKKTADGDAEADLPDLIQGEEASLILAISLVLGPKMSSAEDTSRFRLLLRDVFPQSSRPKSGSQNYNPQLVNALQEQLLQDGLQTSQQVVNKILSLYSALMMKQGVILVGSSGSGKTTVYRTLCRAMNTLHNKDSDVTMADSILREKDSQCSIPQSVRINNRHPNDRRADSAKSKLHKSVPGVTSLWESLAKEDKFVCPNVDLQVIYSNAMECQQLFGYYEDGVWKPGLFTSLLTNAHLQAESAKSFMSSFDERKFKIPIQPPKKINKWFVLDGTLHSQWVDNMASLLDREEKLTLANQLKVSLPDTTSLIFEVADMTNSSPSMISRCMVVHCGEDTTSWKFLVQSWLVNAKEKWIINTASIQVLNSLISSVFPVTLSFLQSDCCTSLLANVSANVRQAHQVAPGIQEVTSFLRFLTAFMNEHFLRENWEKKLQMDAMIAENRDSSGQRSARQSGIVKIEEVVPNYMTIIKGMFAFSYIWGFGGNLHDRYKQHFSQRAQEILKNASQPITLPDGASVYDVYFDVKHGVFNKWADKQMEKCRSFASHYAVTPEIDCYNTLLDMLLRNRQPVLLVGEPGVGKTSLVSNLVQVNHQYTRIVMSPVMTASRLQQMMVAKMLDLKSRTVDPIFTNASRKSHCLFYIDDLNTAHANPETGVQSSLELLRELLSEKTIYEPNRHVLVSFQDADILATTTNPGALGTGCGYSSHVMSPRLTRLFTTLTYFTPDEPMLHGLYTRTIHSWLEEFPTRTIQHHMEFAKALVQASIDVYKMVKERLRASPVNPHYVFSLADIAHHIQGILLMSPRSKTKLLARAKKHADQKHRKFDSSQSGTESLASELSGVLPEQMRSVARLWCHESTRVYGDRIIGEDEQNWFETALEDVVIKNFCTGSDDWQEKMSTITEVLSQGDHPTSSEISGSLPSVTPSGGEMANPDAQTESDIMDHSARTKSVDPQNTTPTPMSSRPESRLTPKPPTPPGTKLEQRLSSGQPSADGQRKMTPASQSPAAAKDNHLTESTASSRTSHLSRDKAKTEASSYEEDSDEDDEEDSSCSSSSSSEDETDSETMTSTDAASRSQESPNHQIIYADSYSMAADKFQHHIKDSKRLTNDTQQVAAHGIGPKPKDVSLPDGSSSKLSYGTQATVLRKGGKAVNKRGVTFKTGLIADMVEETYTGPLMTLDQIKETDERLTEFIFCKHIVPMHAEAFSMHAERGYTEYIEEQLSEALYSCLALYNKASSMRIELVFFREAVQHAARLSRVLALPGGHALLLSRGHSTGRSTLVRLAAFFAHCKLFEPKLDPDSNNQESVVFEHIRQCSKMAAIQGKQVVLLIQQDLGAKCLDNVCAFMKEGMYPGLYTPDEIQTIAQQMTPGQVKTTRLDKIEAAFSKFIRRVQQNLHVIICFSYTGNSTLHHDHSLYTMLQKYSMLTTHCCHIDVYHPWTYEAYMSVAEYWLRDPNSKIAVPWNEHSKAEQMYLVAMAMSYIHQSSMVAVEKLYSHQRTSYKFFSPLTFTEFIHIFKVIASHIAKEEKSKIFKHESSLAKVNEAYESITAYKRQVSNLFPRHQKALAEVKEHVEYVEVQREQYKQALDTCKEEEQRIECMLSPLEALRAEAQIEFDKVNPTYHAALSALKSLEKAAVEEIKTYRIPPKMVSFVLEAVCLLFREPQNWETAKGMLIRDTFFHELEFYDKDNIPDDIYEKLSQFYHHPDFNVDTVKATSSAVSHLCWWVRSVYEYATICRTMKPRLQMLEDAEEKLNKAQAILGTKRVEANRIKSTLESRIHAHSEAVKKVKAIEKEIQSIERKITKATNIMDNMQMQHTLWKFELRTAKSKIRTAPGDALIAAAVVCYHGPLDNRTRAELMHDWLSRCEMTNFDPTLRLGRQVKPVSLSAKMENFMRPQTYSITDSVHSIQQVELYQAEIASHRGDDVSSIHETERASSASSIPQLSLYRHQPSVYDTGIGFKTEIRVLDNTDTSIHGNPELESIDASSISSRNLLSVRENYTLQDVLSDFNELSEWKLKGLPTDVHSIHNAVIMKVCCYNRKHCWPLLIDPDQQAELWVRTIQQGSALLMAEQDNGDRMNEAQLLSGCHSYDPHSDSAKSRVTDDSAHSSMTDDSTTISARTDSRGLIARRSALSMNTVTDDYNGVSSTRTTTESIKSKIAQSVERPEDNLWVVASDDQDLEAKIVNAVIHGVCLLITHIERKPLDPLFRPLIFKQFAADTNGQQVIRIGDVQLPCHPNFALFFSSSVPLFLEGDGIYKLMVEKMCPIDFSLSQELIIDTILSEILKIDRPEFDGQRRSMDRDIINHQREINEQQDVIMKKTLCLECAILEDKTMLESLMTCQKQVNMHKSALEESQYLREVLEEKRAHLITVATHGAKIYEIIQRISVLNPLYHVTLSQFMSVIKKTVQSHHRGKGSTGAPKARAQELINAITSSVHDYVSLMLFESDLKLFVLLVTLERLRMSQQLTNQELGLFVNGFESSELEDNIMFDDKPMWLSNKVWLDCAGLETTVDAFHQLRQSLTRHSKEWQEYFKCPVVLLSDVPGTELVDLTIFQKCLLWRICCPQKMVDICEALVLHELGGLVGPAKNFSMQEAYLHSDSATPVIFILPNVSCQQETEQHHNHPGFSFANPTRQIHQFARECGMDGKVHVITCGTELQLSELHHALHEGINDGYWLVIQNAHLSGTWNKELLEQIRTIVFSKNIHKKDEPVAEEDTPDEESLVTSEDNDDTVSVPVEQTDGTVHKDFRLWITTRSDQGHLIPGLLIQHGVKVTCEQVHNIRDTLKRTYSNTEALLMMDNLHRSISKIFGNVSVSVLLSLLYSVVVHRRCYGRGSYNDNYYWSQMDLALIIDQFKVIARLCQRSRGLSDITELVLSGHCVDPEDQKIIAALVNAIIQDPGQLKQLTTESPGITSLLSHLLGCGTDTTFEERVNSLVDIDASMMSLPVTAQKEMLQSCSRRLLSDLVRVIGAPELISLPVELSNRRAENILHEVFITLETFPELPEMNPNAFYPFELFLQQEVLITRSLIGQLKADVIHLLSVVRGQVCATRQHQMELLTISQQRVPFSWYKETFPACTSLTKWVALLRRRVIIVSDYLKAISEGQEPVTFDLGAFHRPNRFFDAILLDYVRRKFKDLQRTDLEVQFLPVGITPTSPPSSGVYLSSITLHNASWCPRTMALTDASSDHRPTRMPIIWLKPSNKSVSEKWPEKNKYHLYDCPLYYSSDSRCLSSENIITRLKLPTFAEPRLWTERRTFLSCQLNN